MFKKRYSYSLRKRSVDDTPKTFRLFDLSFEEKQKTEELSELLENINLDTMN
jgi:hypothetical protein